MVSIIEKIISLFRRKNDQINEEEFQESYKVLKYNGQEDLCRACNYPIHMSQSKQKVKGKTMHKKCYKKLRKMMLKGESRDGFE